MPSLGEFEAYALNWSIKVKAAGAMSVSTALNTGAAFMRESIAEGSPTGTDWHTLKNDTNGYPDGSRIGNRDSSVGPIHHDAGNMFRSVQAEDAKVSPDVISGKFGWISDPERYFGQQDAGNYGKGKKRGMGLINFQKGNSVNRKIGAAIAAEESLISAGKSNGFSISGNSEWKDDSN